MIRKEIHVKRGNREVTTHVYGKTREEVEKNAKDIEALILENWREDKARQA